jgi:type II secretion system protein H
VTRRACRRHRAGFTLIEVVIVLVVIGLVLGLTLPTLATWYQHEELQTAGRDLAMMVKSVRRRAVADQKIYFMEFSGKYIQAYSAENPGEAVEDLEIPESVVIQVRPWGGRNWERPKEHQMLFTAAGVLEPYSVLLKMDKAWLSYRFDPLTGAVAEEEAYFP